jgi:SAM-dependent methyltransferase
MYSASPNNYLEIGLGAIKIFDYAINEGFIRPDGPRNILDLPCGHGRVSRFLRARFPGVNLTVCDIDPDGVDFCVNLLGAAKGVYSSMDFDKLDLGEVFDIIWVGSLITHLDAVNTVKFLRCMERFLSDEGILIITNHGKTVADLAPTVGEALGMGMYPPNWVINQYNIIGYGSDANAHIKGYGESTISRHWLEGFFAGEPCGIIEYLEHGWEGYQDVLFIKKRPLLPAEFDAEMYLKINKDVADAGADPVQHYLLFGRKEGRSLR